ncbi:MAG: alanine:cation symporter family protein [Firmicutes bacterium]|nr:alanine:cation symporter family protein [Bacillota bacterium]
MAFTCLGCYRLRKRYSRNSKRLHPCGRGFQYTLYNRRKTRRSAFYCRCHTFFAFTTILGRSHYGTKAIEYLSGNKAHIFTKIYKLIFVFAVLFGSIATSSIVWDISDTFNGLMMLPNLIGVLSLSPILKRKISKKQKKRERIKLSLNFTNILLKSLIFSK